MYALGIGCARQSPFTAASLSTRHCIARHARRLVIASPTRQENTSDAHSSKHNDTLHLIVAAVDTAYANSVKKNAYRRRSPTSNDLSEPLLSPPRLPPAPDFPCPVLTDEEIEKYLAPLYDRHWGVTKRIIDAPKIRGRRIAIQLTGVFLFPEYKDAMKFVQEVGQLAEVEFVSPITAWSFLAAHFCYNSITLKFASTTNRLSYIRTPTQQSG